MKIVHISITSAFSEIYAYQQNLLAHYHKTMGHDVTMIAPIYCRADSDATEPAGERILPDGVKLIRLLPLINNVLITNHLKLVRGLKKTIYDEKPDLLFIHGPGCFNYLCLKSVRKKFPDVKIVIDNHADFINSLHTPVTRFLHKVLYRYFLVPTLMRVTDWFYGVTPSRCDFLRDVYGVPQEKIRLLVMGADDEKMDIDHRVEHRKEVRERYDIKQNDFLIVTGGKIDKKKNIHVFAHAVNELHRENVKLLVFGKINEDMQPLFDAEKSPNIVTIGWVNSDKVYELYYAADLIVFPGLHSVLWEQAVASKTPCAFSKIDGFRHVNINDNCILMEGKDDAYYQAMIKSLLDTPDRYPKLKSNADSPQTERFYYSNIAKQVLEDVGLT